jgi:hypothetical protein
LPWLLVAIRPRWFFSETKSAFDRQSVFSYAVALLAVALMFTQTSFEDQFGRGQARKSIVRRDNTATIVATGTGLCRLLLVNVQGITGLVPATKMMAHLPLAFRHPPKMLWPSVSHGHRFARCSWAPGNGGMSWFPASRGCSGSFMQMALICCVRPGKRGDR